MDHTLNLTYDLIEQKCNKMICSISYSTPVEVRADLDMYSPDPNAPYPTINASGVAMLNGKL